MSLSMTVERKPFLAAMNLALSVASRSSYKPILRTALFSVDRTGYEDWSFFLEGTDLETSLRCPAPGCKAEPPFYTEAFQVALRAALPAKLATTLSDADDEAIGLIFSLDGRSVEVTGEHSRHVLKLENAAEFPAWQPGEAVAERSFAPDGLSAGFRRTAHACDQNSTTFALGGICMVPDGLYRMSFEATDGRRYATQSVECEEGAKQAWPSPPPIVPAKAAQKVASLLAGHDKPVRVAVAANWAEFRAEPFCLRTRLVEGRFPPFRRCISDGYDGKASSTAAALLKAINRASVSTDEQSLAIDFTFSEGLLLLESAGQPGESEVELPLDCDVEIDLAFRPAYWVDLLKNLPGEAVVSVDLAKIKDRFSAIVRTEDGFSAGVARVTRPDTKDGD